MDNLQGLVGELHGLVWRFNCRNTPAWLIATTLAATFSVTVYPANSEDLVQIDWLDLNEENLKLKIEEIKEMV